MEGYTFYANNQGKPHGNCGMQMLSVRSKSTNTHILHIWLQTDMAECGVCVLVIHVCGNFGTPILNVRSKSMNTPRTPLWQLTIHNKCFSSHAKLDKHVMRHSAPNIASFAPL